MDRRILYVIGAAAAALLSSCAKVEMTEGGKALDPNQIAFSVRSGLQGPSGTRSGAGEEQPAMLLSGQGEDTLYLHPSVVVNDRGFGMPATRDVPVTKDSISSFTVTAKVHGSETPYMNEVEVTRQGDSNVWTTSDGKHFWPDERTSLDFYAYSNLTETDNPDSPGVSGLTCNGGQLGFSYIVPNGPEGSDAVQQPDILFALASANRSQTQDDGGTVILNFQHALAGVQFRAKNIAGGTIQSITLKNLYGQGDCTYTLSDETTGGGARKNGTFKWSTLGTKTDFTQKMSVKVSDSGTLEDSVQDITTNGKNSEMTFMMIPQSTADVEVEIVLEGDNNETYTVSGKLGNTGEWRPGYIYIYDISTDSINWEYVFEVTPSITLPLGTTTGQYTVTSYRQRKGDPSTREAVAWKAENTGFSETDQEDGTSVETTLDEILSDFTYQDENPSETDKSYSLEVTTTTLKTTHKGDQTLKKNTPQGSEDSPYDLSTHDENGSVIAQTTANCYVVSAAGTYQLPLVYGNALKNGSENRAAYQGFKDYQDHAISSPRITGANNAVLVWSDGFFMFKDIHLDASKQNLVFTIDPDYMQQANAVLAVRDASNRIMWSWHIWVTERPVYKERHILQDLFNSSNTYELMQCNLGWVDGKMVYYNQRDLTFRFTQAGSGKTAELKVTQKGATFDYKDVGSTYYQWGRKDPLVALKNWDSYRYEDYRLHETGDPNYVYRYETGPTDIGNAIQHPNVFYTRGTTGGADWNNEHITTLWNARDNGGTLESTTSVKTIYDPSPRGFKVPIPRAFAIFVGGNTGDGSSSSGKGELNGHIYEDDVHNKYRVYPRANQYKEEEIPLTATGQRADVVGLPVYEEYGPLKSEVGGLWSLFGVYYWTCVPKNTTSAYTLVIRKDYPSGLEVYSYGFVGTKTMARPVRPIKD